jgi:hypothetical protein
MENGRMILTYELQMSGRQWLWTLLRHYPGTWGSEGKHWLHHLLYRKQGPPFSVALRKSPRILETKSLFFERFLSPLEDRCKLTSELRNTVYIAQLQFWTHVSILYNAEYSDSKDWRRRQQLLPKAGVSICLMLQGYGLPLFYTILNYVLSTYHILNYFNPFLLSLLIRRCIMRWLFLCLRTDCASVNWVSCNLGWVRAS